jgi:hypothetical protein
VAAVTPLRLHPDDLAALAGLIVDGLAEALPARLNGPPRTGRLIDAAEVARRNSVDRAWVYSHADELGAVRIGDGPRPRLRFDPERVREAFACSADRSAVEPAARGAEPNARRRRRARAGTAAPLLPIRGDGRRAA